MIALARTEGCRRSDSHGIVLAANERLRQSWSLGLQDFFCECDDGVLLLRGRVSTFFQKQLAQEAVRHLEGVVQVVNEIEVVEHLGVQWS